MGWMVVVGETKVDAGLRLIYTPSRPRNSPWPSMQSYPRANGTESRPGPRLENSLEKFRHLDLSYSQSDMEAGSLGQI